MEKDQFSQVSIEDLPAEMLQIVLNYLDVPSLLACRLVCRKWNEMFTPILHTRPETELFFFFSSNTKIFLMKGPGCKYVEQKQTVVQDFVKCVTQSQNSSSRFRPSPFARFSLINIQHWDESISKFLSVVNPTVTCLKLSFASSVMKEPRFTERLRDLLLHETPCLKEFGLGFEEEKRGCGCCGFSVPGPGHKHEKRPEVVKLSLFSSRGKSSSTIKTTLLPKLRVLHVGWSFEFEETVGIFRDILKIAPNLENILQLVGDPNNILESPYCDQDNFNFFLDERKMNLLKCLEFNPSSYFLSHWKDDLKKRNINIKDVSSLFKVEDLQLHFGDEPHIKEVKKEWMEAVQLLEQIFEGSKNTLEKLSISDTVEFPPGFSFPTLTKLSKIKFQTRDFDQELSPFSMFPPGFRLLNIFPNVKTLDLGNFALFSGLKRFFPREDSIPLMPSVHTILFERPEMKGEDVEIMALLCPNVKKLELVSNYDQDDNGMCDGGDGLEDFPTFGLAVFKNMKNLESLHLIIDADARANSFPALDSTFTGISKENCLRFFNESKKEDDDPQEKLRRESELKGLKVNESVLDLPNLKELKISLQSKIDYSLKKDAAAYKSCKEKAASQMGRLSELYAFKLMPGLKYEIIGQVSI